MKEIKNKEIYIENLNEAAATRYDLNENHNKLMGKAAKLFSLAFNKPAKDIVVTKNALYYMGGWPSENTPAKLFSLALHISVIVKYLSYCGKLNEFTFRLRQFGITLTWDESFEDLDASLNDIPVKKIKKMKKLYSDVFGVDGDEMFAMSKKDLFSNILQFMMEEQKEICALADSIKDKNAAIVEAECEVKKPHFIKTVGLKVKEIKTGNIAQDLVKIDEEQENLNSAISVLSEDNS